MVGLREEFAVRPKGRRRRLFLGQGGSPGLLRLRPMESPATLRPALASASSASADDRAQSTQGVKSSTQPRAKATSPAVRPRQSESRAQSRAAADPDEDKAPVPTQTESVAADQMATQAASPHENQPDAPATTAVPSPPSPATASPS
ncbi:hypothetical protein PC113_g10026 [Phytophthora cactorum]|uniref:Uncharacterized protein n=1 Tax=Phytophthora cactorum TaxID=29920 RepID=A0A8T0Z7T2_9STRA|nr:hypothetical protein PC113_g10026 [Phytophthora cactorum]